MVNSPWFAPIFAKNLRILDPPSWYAPSDKQGGSKETPLMRGIQQQSVGNTNDHIIFWTRSTSTAVETISVYSEEWITPHLLQSSNRVLPEFVNVESVGSGYAIQTLDSTSSLQDF